MEKPKKLKGKRKTNIETERKIGWEYTGAYFEEHVSINCF